MHITTVSPGSRRLDSPASIPDDPVPERANVRLSSVWYTLRSNSDTSFIISMKSGSR